MRRLILTAISVGGLLSVVVWEQRAEPPEKVATSEPAWLGAVQPRVSPDGAAVVVSYQGAIATVPRAGGVLTRLTQGEGYDVEPVWSADGKRIAYVNSPRFGSGELRVITADGDALPIKPRVEVLGTVLYQKLEWLPDDRLLGVLRVDGVSLGLGWVNLTTGETKSLVTAPTWGRFAVSPDGQWLVYTMTRDQPGQQGGNDGPQADLWRVSTNGGEPEKLFQFPSRIHELCWAADGAGWFIVSELGGGQAHNDVWFVPQREPLTYLRKLTFGQADEDRPSVSRDGRWLVFTDNQRGPTAVVVRDLSEGVDQVVRVERVDFRQPAGRLKVALTDQATGRPITARLAVQQVGGKLSAPPGALYRVLNETGHFYCEQAAEWSLSAGKYHVAAFHGLEYRPLHHDVEVASGGMTELPLALERWTDPASRGWYSGENHIHANYGYGQWYNSPATMLAQCAGENLHVCNFMVANSDTDGIFDREFFRGRLDAASTDDTLLYWNQEFRSTIWGHMTLVNLRQLVEPIMTGFKDTTNPWDVPTNSDIADRTHWQRGHVNYTHAAQNPADPYENPYTGKGLPVDAALGKIDSVDLNATYAGTVVLWHKLLNCGFRLPASAGTDCFLNRITSRLPGADRVYVKLDGPLTYEKWIDGLRSGRSFVTNGPMLEFSLGPHPLGDTIRLDTPRELSVTAKADAQFPLANVELVYNGEVVTTLPLSDDRRHATFSGPLKLNRSGWLSLRASGPGHRDHPTGSLDAHTSPIYVQLEGSPAGTRTDAEYFLKWIDRLSLALRQRDRVPNDDLRRHIQNQIEAARAVYVTIAATGRTGATPGVREGRGGVGRN